MASIFVDKYGILEPSTDGNYTSYLSVIVGDSEFQTRKVTDKRIVALGDFNSWKSRIKAEMVQEVCDAIRSVINSQIKV